MTTRPPRPVVLGLTLGCLGLLAACSGQGGAPEPDLNVTKTDDTFDGACLPRDCSLREAVAAANEDPGPNTIHLPAGNYRLALVGAGEDDAATGDLDLTGEVTVLGAGSETGGTYLTTDPGFGDRLFHVLSGTAVLENIYLGGGEADSGGVVRIEASATLTVQAARLDASKATGPAGGGLIFNAGTLVIEASRLTRGCSTGEGGAISNSGTATLTDSVLEDNEALAAGGAIANAGEMTLSATSINRAFAGSGPLCGLTGLADGGGIFNEGDLTLNGGDIRGEATHHGGSVFTSGTVEAEGTVMRSSAAEGGGVAVASGGRVTLTGADLEAVATGGDGGAVHIDVGGSASIHDSLLAGNATRNGGAVASDGELLLQGTTVTLSRSSDGGGVHSVGTLTIEDSTIRQNSAYEHGGGVYATGTTTIVNSSILGNTADFGGGMFLQGNVVATNCTISGNNANSSGGGVTVWGSGEIQITHCTLTHNTATVASALLADTYATISNSILGENILGPNCDVRRGLLGIGNLDQDGSCDFDPAENVVGVGPDLAPLQDYGGPTETHLLLPDSPARNAAAAAVCLPEDQRGIVRPQDQLCDIGAVEMESGT